MTTALTEAPVTDQKLVRGLGLLDSTMLVAGSMIGSGIFIVSADISRQVGSPGWLLVVWIITGLLTLTAALSYGELAAMMPKTGSLIALILLGILVGWNADAVHINFGDLWHVGGKLQDVGQGLTAATAFGLFVGICVAQTNSLFAADAWNNITFTAGEVKDPRRNIPLSLAFGTFLVIALYLLANVAYLVTLPIEVIKTVPADRVASATADVVFPGRGAVIMAVAFMISTFGCNNGLILAGARAYFAMARDGLFFRRVSELNKQHVPAWGLIIQGIWAALLVLPRTTNKDAAGAVTGYGNLYGNLLDYVISAALIFYILTIIGIFVLRRKRPDAER